MSDQEPGFSQVISLYTDDVAQVVEMIEAWDDMQSTLDVMGYTGTHVLVDRDDPRHVYIVAEFHSTEPGVTAYDEALRNNERPETNEWASKMRELVDGEPDWMHFDEVYRTDF